MKNLKIKMLFFALFFAFSFAVNAQESGTYEYAQVGMGSQSSEWTVVTIYSDRENESISTGLKLMKASGGEIQDALMKEVGRRSKEGWQVVNMATTTGHPIYFMKRKRQ